MLERVEETMSDFHVKLINQAALGNSTCLSPIPYNKRWWSGKNLALEKFIELSDSMIAATDNCTNNIRLNRTSDFCSIVGKYEWRLGEFQAVIVFKATGYVFLIFNYQ